MEEIKVDFEEIPDGTTSQAFTAESGTNPMNGQAGQGGQGGQGGV